MKPAELVAVGIAKISKIELPEGTLTIAGRIAAVTGAAACFDAALVPGVDLFRAVEVEPDRAAIGMAGCLSVDRLRDHENGTVAAVCNAALVVGHRVLFEQGVVEILRSLDVV